MRKQIGVALGAAALAIAGTIPAAAAMGQGPGHDLDNARGVNVLAHADSADYSLAFTSHTSKKGDAHGSIDFRTDGVALTQLDLHRLAMVTADAAEANGCKHGAMWIARGTALFNGTEQVRVWVDLQDRDETSDLVRIRSMALKDHDGHSDGTDDHGTEPGAHRCAGGSNRWRPRRRDRRRRARVGAAAAVRHGCTARTGSMCATST